MKNYCKVIFMCMQVGILVGSLRPDSNSSKSARRRSPAQPSEKTHATSGQRSLPIPLNRSNEMIINSQPKSPESELKNNQFSPGVFIGWLVDDQGHSPAFYD